MKKTTIEHVGLDALIPYARNSRSHSTGQVDQVAASILEFGFTNPVLIDGEGGIIAGHGRVLAARQLGLMDVPCIRLAHLTDEQKRAYVIADNKLAANSEWDENMLQAEIDSLLDAGFDMFAVGFSDEELGLGSEAPAAISARSEVHAVQTRKVADSFWISIRGPLVHQALALQRLQTLMGEMPLAIELGTVAHDD